MKVHGMNGLKENFKFLDIPHIIKKAGQKLMKMTEGIRYICPLSTPKDRTDEFICSGEFIFKLTYF